MNSEMTRRTFIKKSSLVVAATAFSGKLSLINASVAHASIEQTFKPHAFVEIASDNTITVWLGQTNLGQGTHTGISMIIAEELDADWQNIETKMALAAEPFKDPQWQMQVTGGSTSIRHRWDMLRKAGAGARQMLVQAAADEWGIEPGKCSTKESKVLHPDGRSMTYGELVAKAAKLPVPENPPLKDARDYRIIGKERDRIDIPEKVQGTTQYGIDVVVPDMCIATVARPPRYGAQPQKFDEAAAMKVKGVLKVVPMNDKIAVCAENTWAALQGREKLNIEWSAGVMPDLSNESINKRFSEEIEKQGAVAENTGDAKKALSEAEKVLEGTYRFPYASHAQLEPINCTAHVEKDRCRIWVPTQGQTTAQSAAAAITGLPPEKVEVMTTYVGGGFGLRSTPDPVVDAVTLSQAMGRPVKVMWTREDDFANDYFRPGSLSKVKAGLDKNGTLTSWSHKIASPSIFSWHMPGMIKDGIDRTSVQGVPDMVYALPNRLVEYVMVDLKIPVGFWRSVGYTFTTYAVETFIDRLARDAGKDPFEFRFGMMEKGSRPYRTLQLLQEKSGWSSPLADGRTRGIAVASCFGSSAAHMAEVSVDKNSGKVKLHRLVCAIDCGPAVYPDAIVAQMEGGAIMALSLAFHEKVSFSGGGVDSLNFDDYQLLTMSEVPEIEVHIAESIHPIGGVGEPGVPTVAPALANAIFAATGVMLEELPFQTEKLMKG